MHNTYSAHEIQSKIIEYQLKKTSAEITGNNTLKLLSFFSITFTTNYTTTPKTPIATTPLRKHQIHPFSCQAPNNAHLMTIDPYFHHDLDSPQTPDSTNCDLCVFHIF